MYLVTRNFFFILLLNHFGISWELMSSKRSNLICLKVLKGSLSPYKTHFRVQEGKNIPNTQVRHVDILCKQT